MKFTAVEIEYSRQVAGEIGADPDELIREGEALKEEGYRHAYEASREILSGGAGAGQMARLARIPVDPGRSRIRARYRAAHLRDSSLDSGSRRRRHPHSLADAGPGTASRPRETGAGAMTAPEPPAKPEPRPISEIIDQLLAMNAELDRKEGLERGGGPAGR